MERLGSRTYEGMARVLLGPAFDYVTAVLRSLNTFGACVSFIISVGDIFKAILDNTSAPAYWEIEVRQPPADKPAVAHRDAAPRHSKAHQLAAPHLGGGNRLCHLLCGDDHCPLWHARTVRKREKLTFHRQDHRRRHPPVWHWQQGAGRTRCLHVCLLVSGQLVRGVLGHVRSQCEPLHSVLCHRNASVLHRIRLNGSVRLP
ncbi:putative amino acid transporter [Trypanosoma cruzi]|uniref:Putative amino acid transporter n=1 Tax=Trypanosoma cruzi TaxID=5693 RepID=A0A2V2VHD4_TRYCR|nr:putative amino acid transporter [Trypanosoma cruzi]